jgi:DNA-binding response OmpR family regulator
MVKQPRILIVEDDATLSEVVARYLEREGFSVATALDGRVGLETALTNLPDLMVLDIMLPGMDGLEVCRRVRATAPIPIIMLTALGEETDRVMGLELGADDYVTKPFSPRELTARVKSVLRRAGGGSANGHSEARSSLEAAGVRVEVDSREVLVKGEPVSLTMREFELLVHLMRNPRRVLTREELFEAVWGYTIGDTSTVTVHVRRIREKIERDPADPQLIRTVWGAGYRFDP